MKTLLIYPEFPDTYWSFRHALSFEGKRSAFPPLDLLTISAILPDAWERRLVDMNIQPLKPSESRNCCLHWPTGRSVTGVLSLLLLKPA